MVTSLLWKDAVPPSFVRRSSVVPPSANGQRAELPTSHIPLPLPFVATRRVSSAPPHRAREIGDRWPLQDWSIGPCYCPFWPKDCQFGPKDPQFRSGCRNTNSLRWVPRRGKSIIKWGHRRVLEAIWGGFLDDYCHTSDVGSQIVVFLTVSYFIVILLFRRIWQSFHLTFCDSNSCDSWFLEGYVFSLFLYILLIIN